MEKFEKIYNKIINLIRSFPPLSLSLLVSCMGTVLSPLITEITCQPLPQVRDGVVKPLICTAKEVSFGTICQVECLSGYSLVGPERKQCTPEGMWAPESFGEMSRCEGMQIE